MENHHLGKLDVTTRRQKETVLIKLYSSKNRDQSYALKKYLETPQRHETWDWEQKAKRRSDKNHRL